MVNEQNAIKMVDLMLHTSRPKPVKGLFLWSFVKIRPPHRHLCRTLHIRVLLRDGKTPFLVGGHFFGYPSDLGINQDHRTWLRVFLLDAVHHKDSIKDTQLRRSKPDTRRIVHRFQHVFGQFARFFGHARNRFGGGLEPRVRMDEDLSKAHAAHVRHPCRLCNPLAAGNAGARVCPMDFDTPVDWSATDALRIKRLNKFVPGTDNALPMWIADMEFRTPDVILDALRKTVDTSALTYFDRDDAVKEAMIWWMRARHSWSVDPDQILFTFGLGNALAVLFHALMEPDEAAMIFTPVYHEFANRIRAAGRQAIEVPFKMLDDRQMFDLAAAEGAVTAKTRMVVLCSPQNPGGRVWTTEELSAIAAFAEKHDLLIVADEIHHDLVFPGQAFTAMGNIEGAQERLITLTAPSKTFNIAGLRCGQVTIPNSDIRKKTARFIDAMTLKPQRLGMDATAAAYSPEGAEWVDALMVYLDGNRRAFLEGIDAIPGAHAIPMEATYLAWVDFRGLGMSEAELQARIAGKAKIAAYKGSMFGPGGDQFVRINIGTQRAKVEAAIARLQDAFSDLQ